MKMELTVSSETSTQDAGELPKKEKMHLEHSESLKTRFHLTTDFCFEDIMKDKDMQQQVAKKVRYLRILVRWNKKKLKLYLKKGQLLNFKKQNTSVRKCK